jgi:hypothetical protein
MIMTTRVGKIGRLPLRIREELGRRIEDGVPGNEIVPWLNGQAEVQAVLAKYFAGRPINEQNLSDWRQAGHVDWLRLQEQRAWAGGLTEEAEELAKMTGDNDLTDVLTMMLAVQIGQIGAQLADPSGDLQERWKRLREVNRELSVLRRDQDRRDRTGIQRQWREWQMARQDKVEAEAAEQKRRERRLERYNDRLDVESDGEIIGPKVAERIYRIKHGLNEDDLNDGTWEAKREARKAEERRLKMEGGRTRTKQRPANSRSSSCRQHPTSNTEHPTSKEAGAVRGRQACQAAENQDESSLIKANQGDLNEINWTKEELEAIAEAEQRRKQKWAPAGESNSNEE